MAYLNAMFAVRCLSIILSAILLSGCGGGGGSSDEDTDPFVGTRLAPQNIASTQTGWTYPVYVYLPDGYATSNLDYPVIYELDAEPHFDESADILDANAREVILVSIGNTGTERRKIDFTMPGARQYYDFLTLELIPFIDAQYRTDPANRTLAGHSLSGYFVALAMLFKTPGARNFLSFLSSDGTFWYQAELTIELEQQLADMTNELPVNLILSAATEGNVYSVSGFYYLLLDRNYADFFLAYLPYDTSHLAVHALSFQAGIDLLFP
jgi:hypothetical protein